MAEGEKRMDAAWFLDMRRKSAVTQKKDSWHPVSKDEQSSSRWENQFVYLISFSDPSRSLPPRIDMPDDSAAPWSIGKHIIRFWQGGAAHTFQTDWSCTWQNEHMKKKGVSICWEFC